MIIILLIMEFCHFTTGRTIDKYSFIENSKTFNSKYLPDKKLKTKQL